MSIVQSSIDLRETATVAARAQQIQLALGGRRDVPDEAWHFADAAADAIHRAPQQWVEALDPDYRERLLHAALGLAQARADRDQPDARRRLMLSLQRLADVLDRITEAEPVSSARTPQEVARWLVASVEAPQTELAELLSTSTRTLTRWAEGVTTPDGDEARRLRLVAGLISQLRFALTNAGVLCWFDWSNELLAGHTPREVLADPTATPQLYQLATRLRSSIAS